MMCCKLQQEQVSMATPLRLSDELVREAELEGRLSKRTTPKQIELWAEIGKQVAGLLKPGDLVAITQGFARLRVEATASQPVDPEEVLATVEQDRASGRLSAGVTRAPAYYEASRSHPGLLDRVQSDGTRETGRFHEGHFVPMATG